MSFYEHYDLQDSSLHLVSDFFNSLLDYPAELFCEDIDGLLTNGGAGTDYNECKLFTHESAQKYEPIVPEGQVRFGIEIVDEEVFVPYEDFLKYLRMACEVHIRRHPEDEPKLIALFESKGLKLRL